MMTNSARCYRRHRARKAMANDPSRMWDAAALVHATGLEAWQVNKAMAGLVQSGRAMAGGWRLGPGTPGAPTPAAGHG